MNTPSLRSLSITKKVFLAAWAVLFAALVLPFIIVGEIWGMVWYLVAMPLTTIVEGSVGIGSHSYFLIALVSAGTAALWAAVIAAPVWVVVAMKNRANKSPQRTPDTEPAASAESDPRRR